MKKLTASILGLGFLSWATNALAQINVNITPPPGAINPGNNVNIVGVILNNAIRIVFIVAVLAVLVMLIWGAFQWITSGGDKEAVGKARGRITAALIGFAILALAFVIILVVGSILGVNILGGGLVIPSLTSAPTPVPARP